MGARSPRHRYIAFRVEGLRAFQRKEMMAALRDAPARLSLVEFDGTLGLVRTTNFEKDAAIQALVAIDAIAGQSVRLVTLGTSGTIRTATRKYLTPRRRAAHRPENKPFK